MTSNETGRSTDSAEWTWRDVKIVIEDLKRDGYQPSELKSSTSEPRPEKSFLLRVERSDTSTEESP